MPARCGGALWGWYTWYEKDFDTFSTFSVHAMGLHPRCGSTAVARGDVEERLAMAHVNLKCQYACGVVFGGWYVYLAPNLTSPDKGSCEVWVGG